jgi:trigger factor
MKLDVISVGSFQKKLAFTVPAEKVRSELDTAYRQLGQKVRMKGFRPGKAPRPVLEARYGDQVRSDVANNLIQQSYRSALTEHALEPVSRPSLETAEPVKPGADFAFTITIDVRPEVELSRYIGVDVAWPKNDVSDAEVDAAAAARTEGAARLVEVTDRPVQAGDMVLCALVAKDGDTEVAREMGTMIRTGGDPYYPGVEALTIGRSIGDKAQGSVTFADDARTEAVRGRTLQVEIEIQGIQASEAPPLTDELATELGFEGGVEGMRVALRGRLQERREELGRNQARANLLEALIAANPFDVPASMVDDSLKMLLEELKLQQAWRSGRDPKTITFTEAQVRDLRSRAEFASKSGLILAYVARKEGLVVTDAELEAKYQELADTRGQTLEAVKGYFLKDGAVEELRERIAEEKVLDWLLERSNVVTPESGPAMPSGALADVAESLVDKAVSEKKTASAARKKREAASAPAEEVAAAAPAPAAEEKPKKKPAAKKKAEEAPIEAAAAEPAPAAEEKPKKKPAAKKKAAE